MWLPRSRGVPAELVMEQLFPARSWRRGSRSHERARRPGRAARHGLAELLSAFIEHRMESGPGLALRLGKIDDRLEILDGYLKVFLDIDAVTASSARRTSRAPC